MQLTVVTWLHRYSEHFSRNCFNSYLRAIFMYFLTFKSFNCNWPEYRNETKPFSKLPSVSSKVISILPSSILPPRSVAKWLLVAANKTRWTRTLPMKNTNDDEMVLKNDRDDKQFCNLITFSSLDQQSVSLSPLHYSTSRCLPEQRWHIHCSHSFLSLNIRQLKPICSSLNDASCKICEKWIWLRHT